MTDKAVAAPKTPRKPANLRTDDAPALAQEAAARAAAGELAGQLRRVARPNEVAAGAASAQGVNSFGKQPKAVAAQPPDNAALRARSTARPAATPDDDEATPATADVIKAEFGARKAGPEAPQKPAGVVDRTGAVNILENVLEHEEARTPEGDAAAKQGREAIQQLLADPAKKLSPEARSALTNFLDGGATLPGGEGQPKAGFVDTAQRYEPVVSGPVAPNTPKAADVRQGDLGNCYFAAAMASVAQTNPDAIRNAIRERPDGRYDVTLFDRGGPGGTPRERTITVDGKLPVGADGQPAYMQPVNGQTWAPILEKAFAQMQGGYGHIGAGGNSEDAMFALTGRSASATDISPSTNARERTAHFESMRAALQSGRPVTAGTTDEHRRLTARYDSSHQYAVTGVGGQGANRYVEVLNPYGLGNAEGEHRSGVSTEQYQRGRTTATIRVPLDKFYQRFDGFVVGG